MIKYKSFEEFEKKNYEKLKKKILNGKMNCIYFNADFTIRKDKDVDIEEKIKSELFNIYISKIKKQTFEFEYLKDREQYKIEASALQGLIAFSRIKNPKEDDLTILQDYYKKEINENLSSSAIALALNNIRSLRLKEIIQIRNENIAALDRILDKNSGIQERNKSLQVEIENAEKKRVDVELQLANLQAFMKPKSRHPNDLADHYIKIMKIKGSIPSARELSSDSFGKKDTWNRYHLNNRDILECITAKLIILGKDHNFKDKNYYKSNVDFISDKLQHARNRENRLKDKSFGIRIPREFDSKPDYNDENG